MDEVLIGAISSGVAAIFTNPLEIWRTKLVVDDEEAKFTYTKTNRRNTFEIFRILVAGGMKNLEAGLAPTLSYHVLTNGIRLGFYSSLESRGLLAGGSDGLKFAKSVSAATGDN
jgi:hypothetical protein